MLCGLLYGMWAAGYKTCSICGLSMVCGLLRVCGLFYGIWAAGYMTCSICGLLYGMWGVEWYVGCCIVCGLLDIRPAVYLGC